MKVYIPSLVSGKLQVLTDIYITVCEKGSTYVPIMCTSIVLLCAMYVLGYTGNSWVA